MKHLVVYACTITAFVVTGWVILSRIKTRTIRVLLRTGLLSVTLTPAFYFKGKNVVFAPAWALLSTVFASGTGAGYFLHGIASIVVVWFFLFVSATLIIERRDRQEGK